MEGVEDAVRAVEGSTSSLGCGSLSKQESERHKLESLALPKAAYPDRGSGTYAASTSGDVSRRFVKCDCETVEIWGYARRVCEVGIGQEVAGRQNGSLSTEGRAKGRTSLFQYCNRRTRRAVQSGQPDLPLHSEATA